MKESNLNRRAIDYCLARCRNAVYYKIADRFTAGIPDSVFTWEQATSWLEFKLLNPNESIHDQLDKKQLIELLKLQVASQRAWVIAYRRPRRLSPAVTEIYMPSALWHEQVPSTPYISKPADVLVGLRTIGVSCFEGHCHEAVYELIRQTHAPR